MNDINNAGLKGANAGKTFREAIEEIILGKWQPIETAPKDRPILAYNDESNYYAVVQWYPESNGTPYWELTVGNIGYDNKWNPTHWMPIQLIDRSD